MVLMTVSFIGSLFLKSVVNYRLKVFPPVKSPGPLFFARVADYYMAVSLRLSTFDLNELSDARELARSSTLFWRL